MGRTKQTARMSLHPSKAPRKNISKMPRKGFGSKSGGGGATPPKGPDENKIKKPRRFRPGTVSLREIRKYQKNTDLLIPKAPFARLVRELVQELRFGDNLRITSAAFMALHTAAEEELTHQMEAYNLGAIHGGRVTIMQKDMRHARQMHSVLPGRPVDRIVKTNMFMGDKSLVKAPRKKSKKTAKKTGAPVTATPNGTEDADAMEEEEEEEPLNMALVQGDD
jgi:histone H3